MLVESRRVHERRLRPQTGCLIQRLSCYPADDAMAIQLHCGGGPSIGRSVAGSEKPDWHAPNLGSRCDRGFGAAHEAVTSGAIGSVQLMRSLTRDPGLANPATVPPWTIFLIARLGEREGLTFVLENLNTADPDRARHDRPAE